MKLSLVAQMVKNLPAMQETRVQSLGQEDPLEEEMATHSSGKLEIPIWCLDMFDGLMMDVSLSKLRKMMKDRGARSAAAHGDLKESDMTERLNNNLDQAFTGWNWLCCWLIQLQLPFL